MEYISKMKKITNQVLKQKLFWNKFGWIRPFIYFSWRVLDHIIQIYWVDNKYEFQAFHFVPCS